MRVRGDVNFLQNQMLFPVAHKLATAPSSPVEGQFYYDSGKQLIYVWSGSGWVACGLGSHYHVIGDITNLQMVLDSKTPYGHTHHVSDIVDISGLYALASHLHNISDVTGLQTSLDAKASLYHGHSISDITGLQTALDGKAASSHSHVIGDVTGLQSALDGKSGVGHGHSISDVTGLQSALDGKAASSHSHAISDITNLSGSLNAKYDKSGGGLSGAMNAYAHGTATNWEVVNIAYGTSSTPPSNSVEGCVYLQYQ